MIKRFFVNLECFTYLLIFLKYLLVRISKTIFRDQFSRNNFRGKARQSVASPTLLADGLFEGGVLAAKTAATALKNKAVEVFDKAAQDKVFERLPNLVTGACTGSCSQPTNNGNKGNSGGKPFLQSFIENNSGVPLG